MNYFELNLSEVPTPQLRLIILFNFPKSREIPVLKANTAKFLFFGPEFLAQKCTGKEQLFLFLTKTAVSLYNSFEFARGGSEKLPEKRPSNLIRDRLVPGTCVGSVDNASMPEEHLNFHVWIF
jgi:hypothetical protein